MYECYCLRSLHFQNYLHRHAAVTRSKLLVTLFMDAEEDSFQQLSKILKEFIFFRHKYSTWRQNEIFPLSNTMVQFLFFDIDESKTWYIYSEWTNQIELSVLPQMTSRSDFKLRGHEMVEQFLPIHWSSLVSTPKTVCWTGKFWSGNYLNKNTKEFFEKLFKKIKACYTIHRSRCRLVARHGTSWSISSYEMKTLLSL